MRFPRRFVPWNNDVICVIARLMPTPSLRGFEQAVAISFTLYAERKRALRLRREQNKSFVLPNRSNEKKRSALKGRFGGIVDITEDSNGFSRSAEIISR